MTPEARETSEASHEPQAEHPEHEHEAAQDGAAGRRLGFHLRRAPRLAFGAFLGVCLVLLASFSAAEPPSEAWDFVFRPIPGDSYAEPADPDIGIGIFVFAAREDHAAGGVIDSGSNPLFAWRELEPQQGVYNWAPLDKVIAAAEAAGRTIVPRILTNSSIAGQATPEWFFAIPGAQRYYPSALASSSGFVAPVPWDPVFQQEFGRFLSALGQRYNGNPSIEYFQTNAGGGLYGEIVMTTENRFPAGWSPEQQLSSIVYWLDRWLEAFPATALSLMINPVSYDIGESAAAYAAERGVYLQQNSPWLSPESVALFAAHQHQTRIVVEAEDGCRSAEGPAFDAKIEAIFSHGFAVDYLHLCHLSFSNPASAAKLAAIDARLRKF